MKPDWFGKLSRDLVDDGLLIEAGWQALRAVAMPANTPKDQIAEMRNAFFAGAQHVFSSIMSMLEEGAEPTENDLARMTQINDELDRFVADYKQAHHLQDH